MKLSITQHVRVGFDGLPTTEQPDPLVALVSVGDGVVELRLERLEELLGLVVERKGALLAEVSGVGVRGLTPGAFDRGDVLGDVFPSVDLDPVHRRVLRLLGLPGELRDVPGDDRRAAGPSLAVLDEGLGLLALREPVSVGLPEVRRRDGLLDASARCGRLEHVEERLVAQPRGLALLRPEEVVVTAGVLGEPVVEVRHREDEVDVVLPALAVDADLRGVVAIGDLPDGHVVELAAAESPLELDGDRRRVPFVAGPLEHGLDLVVEVEHVGGVGSGVVVPGGLRRDPLVGLGDVLATGAVLGEEAERDAVVAVRLLGALLGVVRVVDPRDDDLRDVLRVVEDVVGGVVCALEDGVDEVDVGLLAHAHVVPEELLVARPAVVLALDLQLVAEGEQQVAVGVSPAPLPALELLAEGVDRASVVVSHGPENQAHRVKGLAESPPPALTKTLTIPRGSGCGTAEVIGFYSRNAPSGDCHEPHVAIGTPAANGGGAAA